jgi:hypothetical protein
MAYVYLIDLHQLIGQRLEDAEKGMNAASADLENQRFHEGRVHMLTEFQDFLYRNYHHKLPRRLSARFKKNNGTYMLE